MSITSLRSQRAAAGTRYAAAVAELHNALVDLAALDQALANGNVASEPLNTFSGPPDSLNWSLAHPVYAPRQTAPNWHDEIRTARDGYIASAAS